MIGTPRWWYRPPEAPGLIPRLLSPLGALYAAGTRRRLAHGPRVRLPVPVICVGNLVAGGAGKTPTAIWILEQLAARGVVAHVVSRGHGGRLAGPVRVEPARHRARDVGDEPLLLSAFAPSWVARDRLAGAQAAVAAGAQLVVLDDGFQNPALAHDLALVVVDAARGFGNGRPIPAGPLREPVGEGLARADLLLTIGPPAAQEAFTRRWGHVPAPECAQAVLEPVPMGFDWAGTPVVAFAGIGLPEKFFATLEELGADLRARVALPDHAPISPAMLARLEARARSEGAQLVTTEKDAVRLPPEWRGRVLSLPVRLRPATPGRLLAALERVLQRAPGAAAPVRG